MPSENIEASVNVLNQTNTFFVGQYEIPEILGQNSGQMVPANGTLADSYIWGFIIIVVSLGIIFNFLAICTLFWAKCNGARYFLLQLSFCDVGTLLISGVDLWYINYRKWVLPDELCPVYLGLESFTSTATIYFITAINFHAISTYNLAIKMNRIGNKNDHEYTELSTEQTDDDSCEVNINQQKRYLTIDYSKKKTKISVILPALFIWFLAASISIPLFVFGNVIPNDFNPQVCGIINSDKHNNHIMQIFLFLIRIVVPIACLHLTVIFVGIKLFSAKTKLKKTEVDEDIKSILKLAIVLSVSFAVFSLQRIYGSLYFELISKPFTHYKYPHLNPLIGLGFAMLGLVIPCIRPCIYYAMDKGLRSSVSATSNQVRERNQD